MRCRVGDLAYIVVPPGIVKTIDRKFVTVLDGGVCDLDTYVAAGDPPAWMCRFHVPWTSVEGRVVRQCWIFDSWLRPVRDPGRDAVDEMVQILRDRRAEKAREPDPAYIGQTAYTDFGRGRGSRGWV